MAEETTKFPGKAEENKSSRPAEWRPLESLRRELGRLFNEFGVGSWSSPLTRGVFDVEPFWCGEVTWGKAPAVDIAEHETAYEITAELPGMDESNIDVKFSEGTLTKGRKSRRTIISPNAAMAPSSVRSACRTALMPTRSRRISRTVYSRSRCRRGQKHRRARRRSPSIRREARWR
jgi:HSP20 family molecular chaperone IbpA